MDCNYLGGRGQAGGSPGTLGGRGQAALATSSHLERESSPGHLYMAGYGVSIGIFSEDILYLLIYIKK